ncbi:site-specific tyrosine recombinase XerC [Caballeronia terrestris]|uniref:Site-specific tyrosine recombinase XerC n=1 Tax=Caballeronia terrestris TaxID=1226301 RepID=A0A158KQT3_9BURK|nr:hypothetical protein [Caballeronia terrestris]SAL83516.1 site-specific tyrosine recombinase XerC [Caballeronia terrestris]
MLGYVAKSRIKVHGFRVHSLRATAATNTLEHDADIASVQEWLGHANFANEASDAAGQGRFKRAIRLVDAYLNVSGHNTHTFDSCIPRAPFNFPASSFLRPYSRKLAAFEGLRLRRIKKAMTDAAVNKRLYHLWWHPHNFGKDTARNIEFLKKIAEHYRALNRTYGFRSLNMGELSDLGENAWKAISRA